MKHLLSTIRSLRHWIILVVVFLFPIFFLPITPDFYQTNKLYLVMVSSLMLALLWIGETLMSGKAILSITNSIKGLGIVAVAIFVTTLLGTPNIIESLLTPLGVLLFISLFLFVLFAQAHEEHHIKTSFLVSIVILAIITIYHASGITKTLASKLIFFRDPLWSPAGSMQIALVLMGTSVPMFIHAIANGWGKRGKARMEALLPIGGLVIVVVATVLASYIVLLKNPLPNLSLPTTIQIVASTWKQTKPMLTGVGLASYINAFANGKPGTINQTPAWNTYFTQGAGLFAHIATTNGIVGLIALLIAWLAPLAAYRKKGSIQREWGILGSYLVLMVFMIVMPPTLPLVLLWMTLILCMEHLEEKVTVEHNVATTIARGFVSAVSAILLLILFYLLGRSYIAYTTLYESLKAVDRRDGTAAYQWAVQSLQFNPFLSSSHLYFSQINLELAKALATKETVTEQDRNTIASLIAQAIREARTAIASDPTSPITWVNLARMYETLIPITQGADQWAIASYQQAAIFDPVNPLIRFALGAVSVTRKDYDGAINYFSQAALLKPDFANAYYNLANAYKLKGDVANQTQMLQKVIALVSKDSTDYTKVVNELAELDRQKAASAAAQPNQATKPQPGLTTPPSGKPIIVPPLTLPSEGTK